MLEKPLVSIGLPTCNRAELLDRALKSLKAQDYPEIEIVVSDNASTDNTAEVCRRYPSICYTRTLIKVPVFGNFRRVLMMSMGKYFMWASDDDLWESNFVSTLVQYLETHQGTALVAAEAQYMTSNGVRLPFFPEGKSFYDRIHQPKVQRLLLLASHSYGNLIYGLYRRESLLTNSGTILDDCKFTNEIPLFLQVADRGRIRVLDKVLFYKTASILTYLQAAREYGFKPDLEATFPKSEVLGTGIYHMRAGLDILGTIWHLDVGLRNKITLSFAFTKRLARHFLKLTVAWRLRQ